MALGASNPGASGVRLPLDDVLAGTETRAFLVVHEGKLVYERYFDGAGLKTLGTSFSVAKSLVSTLVGIAIDEGTIGDVRDPLTRYVPELRDRDRRFAEITLGDLLTMSSGLRYKETDLPWPWSDDTYTYYGTDLREVALERSEVEGPPGEWWHYNNYNPLLLGLVLERATGTPVFVYASTRLWRPIGAAHDASWSLDSEDSGFEKLESGVNATARDYARFGLLMLRQGRLNGRQLVSSQWVRAATKSRVITDYGGYGYMWWMDPKRPGRFYAFGKYGQYIYVAPDAGTVIVRLGSDWGIDNDAWLATFREVAERLLGSPTSHPARAG